MVFTLPFGSQLVEDDFITYSGSYDPGDLTWMTFMLGRDNIRFHPCRQPKFIESDRGLVNQDLVAWHVFGLHHMLRAEDFPVQPCISCGFKLMPVGFFDNSNALDLPWEKNAASCHAKSSG